MQKCFKIAIASLGNPREVKTWSGIPAYITSELEKRGHIVTGITLDTVNEPWYYDWLRRIYYWFTKKWFLSSVEPRILKVIGKQLDSKVQEFNPDIVLAIHGDLLAYSTFKQPACIIHDTTFATLLGYYADFTNLTRRSIDAGNSMYQKALDRANIAVFSSQWASVSALKDYGADKKKIYTIPFGANLQAVPERPVVDGWIAERSEGQECHFLFIGVNWERKGGPDALQFIKALNAKGLTSKLIVVGCVAVLNPEDEQYVKQVGFLRKNVEKENADLEKLFITCQALLVPSLAECFGCVYCEANAYGLPALGRDTGGVGDIINDGKNGLLLTSNETVEAWADRWLKIWKQKNLYKEMGRNSRIEYEKRLNYTAFVAKLEGLFESLTYPSLRLT